MNTHSVDKAPKEQLGVLQGSFGFLEEELGFLKAKLGYPKTDKGFHKRSKDLLRNRWELLRKNLDILWWCESYKLFFSDQGSAGLLAPLSFGISGCVFANPIKPTLEFYGN